MSISAVRISRPPAWRHEFIRAHNYRCHYCNRPGGLEIGPDARPWHVDHMNPLAEGGEDVEENLVLACKRCNIAKHAQPYARFRRFAKVAFWLDTVESAADEDLDMLLDAYLGTPDGDWFFAVAPTGGKQPHQVWVRPTGEVSNQCDDLVAEIPPSVGRYDPGFATANFLVHAHRLAPQLIAEIRTLRAELREARGNQSEAASESSAA